MSTKKFGLYYGPVVHDHQMTGTWKTLLVFTNNSFSTTETLIHAFNQDCLLQQQSLLLQCIPSLLIPTMYSFSDFQLCAQFPYISGRQRTVRACSRHFQSVDLIEPSPPPGHQLLKNGAVLLLFQWNNFTLPASRPRIWQRKELSNADTATQNSRLLS